MNLTSQIYIELSGKYPNMTSRSGGNRKHMGALAEKNPVYTYII
jgi:hypothetical protein